MNAKFEKYLLLATDSFNAGFTSEASKKAALKYLNIAYNELNDKLHNVILDQPRGSDDKMSPTLHSLYWDIPDNLHQWRIGFAERLLTAIPSLKDQVQQIEELLELRNTMKDAEVVAPTKTESTEAKIMMSIKEIMELRKTQYERGLNLYDLFNGLPVTANVHYVTNQHGTTFLRAFYYMSDTLTPLNVIVAVLQEKNKEKGE